MIRERWKKGRSAIFVALTFYVPWVLTFRSDAEYVFDEAFSKNSYYDGMTYFEV